MREMDSSGIYWIRNKLNNKIYIGSTKNFRMRKNLHFSRLSREIHENNHLQSAYNKYGKYIFEFEILIICDPNMLLFYEQQFLDQLKPEYNICIIAGRPNPIIYTNELRQKISLKSTGRKHSQEVRERMSRQKMGIKFSQKHIENIRKGHIGIKQSKEALLNRSKAMSKKVYKLITPTGEEIITKNLYRFSIENNLLPQSMCKVVNHKLNKHRGWRGEIL